MDVIIYESHVTVEPVFDSKLDEFKEICSKYKFRVAKLLLQKRSDELAIRSNKDSFCTGHSLDKEDLLQRMYNLCKLLKENNFKLWRYKIEAVILDSRSNDTLGLLDDIS